MTTHFDLSTLTRRADDRIHPTLALIEDHWNAQHIDGQVPRRADIAPDALGHALPFTFMLHRVAPGIGRIRVAGQKLHDILRMDPRGIPLSAFFEGTIAAPLPCISRPRFRNLQSLPCRYRPKPSCCVKRSRADAFAAVGR